MKGYWMQILAANPFIVIMIIINIKTKINTDTNFHDKAIPEEKVPCECLSIIILDSALYVHEKYYLKILLDACKHEQKQQKQPKQQQKKNYIDKELKLDTDSNDKTESDSDSSDDDE